MWLSIDQTKMKGNLQSSISLCECGNKIGRGSEVIWQSSVDKTVLQKKYVLPEFFRLPRCSTFWKSQTWTPFKRLRSEQIFCTWSYCMFINKHNTLNSNLKSTKQITTQSNNNAFQFSALPYSCHLFFSSIEFKAFNQHHENPWHRKTVAIFPTWIPQRWFKPTGRNAGTGGSIMMES